MKILKSLALFALLSAYIKDASAQVLKEPNNQLLVAQKPKLFKDSPSRVTLKHKEFDKLFSFEVGEAVSISLASNFLLAGTIVSKAEDKNANVKSIVVRCSDKPGASFTMSRFIHENNTITYSGRIISFKHADAYELVLENESYTLVKKEASDLYEE